MFGEVSYLMNPGSLTTVQLVGVEENIQTKEYTCIQLLCLCLRLSFEVKVFLPFVYLVSVGKGQIGCQFGAIYQREPVAIANMCFFSGPKTCTQIQLKHFKTNHKMQVPDC